MRAGPLFSQQESMIPAGGGQQGFLGGGQGAGGGGGHGGGGGLHSGSGAGAGHCLCGGGGRLHSGSPQLAALSTVVIQPQKIATAGKSFFRFIFIFLSPFLGSLREIFDRGC